MARSTLTSAGLRIVQAAEELFYANGITAVGVDLIAKRSGTTKRTLYNQFGSKDALVAAYLTRRDERWRALVEKTIDESSGPLDALVAPFRALEIWSATNTRGCALINALAELPDPGHLGHRIVVDEKMWLLDLLQRLAAAAGCPEPTSFATRLLVLHEGALATLPLPIDTLPEVVDAVRKMVDDATHHAPRRQSPPATHKSGEITPST